MRNIAKTAMVVVVVVIMLLFSVPALFAVAADQMLIHKPTTSVMAASTSSGGKYKTYRIEAESLYNKYKLPDKLQPHPYKSASGGMVVYPHRQPLTWKLQIQELGTYTLWLRARSGYSEDKFLSDGQNKLSVNGSDIKLTCYRQTLSYFGNGENYVWFKSDPITLGARITTLIFSSSWEWAHFDSMFLTNDAGLAPEKDITTTGEAKNSDNGLLVWQTNPYASFTPDIEPPLNSPKPSIQLLVPRNGTAYGALVIHNPKEAGTPVHLVLRLSQLKSPNGKDFSKNMLSIHELAISGLPTGVFATDALPEINRYGSIEIAPGFSRMIWVLFKVQADVLPGIYTASLKVDVQNSQGDVSIPIRLEVASVTLPQTTDLAVFSWWGPEHMPQEWWEDAIAHGTNTFKLSPYRCIEYEFDSNGNLPGKMKFDKLGKHIDAWNRTHGYLLIDWSFPASVSLKCKASGAERGADLKFMTPPWKKAFTTLFTQITEYLKSQGILHNKILQYTFDESLGEEFIAVSKLIRQSHPEYKIFSDLSDTLETYKGAEPYLDIWCPAFPYLQGMAKDGRLEFMRSVGKPIWFYEADYNQRAWDPYSKYRHKFWLTFAFDLDGCTHWKHQGDNVGTAYYPITGNHPVSSRRYEAWYSGVQDYKLLKMVEKIANGKSVAAKKARSILHNAVAKVTNNPKDNSQAEEQRRIILRFLEKNMGKIKASHYHDRNARSFPESG